MSTTPTQLYAMVPRKTPVLDELTGKTEYYAYNHYRPATHDELIAAMPRCGTCGKMRLMQNKEVGVCINTESVLFDWIVDDSLGCTEHKERNT